MCTVLLPPGDNQIAVNKYVMYHVKDINTLCGQDEEHLNAKPGCKHEQTLGFRRLTNRE